MENSVVEQAVSEILKRFLEIDEPKSARFGETKNWDSLRQMKIVLELEDTLNIEFTEAEVVSMRSYGKIVEIISSKCK